VDDVHFEVNRPLRRLDGRQPRGVVFPGVTQDTEAIARHHLPAADSLEPLVRELATQIRDRVGGPRLPPARSP
jgi:hypothetical protein